jgi:hypothetical protein
MTVVLTDRLDLGTSARIRVHALTAAPIWTRTLRTKDRFLRGSAEPTES